MYVGLAPLDAQGEQGRVIMDAEVAICLWRGGCGRGDELIRSR
jgi:hypothetical protein